MKKLILVIAIIFVQYVSYGQTNKKDSSKVSFYKAYDALKSMLEGKDSLNYEKAVFITENAYHNNYFKYEDFKRLLDFHVLMINTYAEDVRTHYKEKYKTLKPWEQKYFKMNTDNWAIFKYITDTAFVIINEDTYYKKPYSYTYQDPYGSNKWENTQVLYLLLSNEKQGNCYSLASLFKIFSDRLKSDARLTIAPHHIYIQNRNKRGDFYNVELASKSFPGDGTIQTLTYTTTTSIMRGMAQRMLNDKQAVALNLIYLAKGYQHKYNDNTNDFLLQCADLAFKYDTLSLNALLLKAEITENRLLASMKENKITKLSKVRTNPKTKELLKSHEEQLSNLYALGYREIPKDIEHIIIDNIQHRNRGYIYKDYTPNPFASIKAKQRYATLSKGLFDEMHEDVDTIQYYHALLNTKTKKIIKLLPIEKSDDYKVDPVVFAMSVDPMADKYPNISPYAYCLWNPVKFIDPNGKEVGIPPYGQIFTPEQNEKYSPTAARIALKITKVAVIGFLLFTQPEIGVPMAVADITGVPVTPSPQAWASTAEAEAAEAVETNFPTASNEIIQYNAMVKSTANSRGFSSFFQGGRVAKASELVNYSEQQGWKAVQSESGPLKYVDENGVARITIKQGSPRTPGSNEPHVELRNANGQRIDASGNVVTRKSPENHIKIDYDLK